MKMLLTLDSLMYKEDIASAYLAENLQNQAN